MTKPKGAPHPWAHLNEKQKGLLRALGAALQPVKRMPLSQWAESNITLPDGSSARPGRLKNWPYMKAILDSIGDDDTERVTVIKSARLGYTKGLMFAMGAVAAMDPCPIILLVPTEDDAKGIAVDEVEPIFEASEVLSGLIKKSGKDGRNTMVRKALLGGGSIKILSARAPRMLRRHDCKVLLIDEADGMEITSEGDPIALAEKRTMAQTNRKIVVGSTPTEEGISVVERLYNQSDMRIYEVPCPKCGVFNEIQWEQIEWENNDPDTAAYRCPHCAERIEEKYKPMMCEAGRYRATKPEIKGHAGYRINALVSLLPNAAWRKLAAEFLKAKKGGPAEMQVFYNTVLARPWRTTLTRVDADTLMSRAEPFGLAHDRRSKTIIPDDCFLITAGADVQDDRIECTILGWRMTGAPYVLGHVQFDGNTLDVAVWKEFDQWLKVKWRHPRGWPIGVDACAVDSGGREGRTQVVYNWCQPRLSRRIYAIKGVPGPRRIWEKAKKVKGDMRLQNVAVDVVKSEVIDAMGREYFRDDGTIDNLGMRFSDQLSDDWYDQATGESRRIRYVRNRPILEWTPRKQGQRVEALDCTVYGWAVRQAPAVRSIDMRARAAREPEPEDAPPPKPKRPSDWAAQFNGR